MGKPGDMTGRAGKKKPEVMEVSGRDLRSEAEKKVTRSTVKTSHLKKQDLDELVHELEVHQVELEMQNDELRRSQAELEAAKERYFELYDLAPVGYFTLSEKGIILEANLTAADMLGVAPRDLRAQRLSSMIYKEDQDIYYLHRQQLFETQAPQACEMRMVRKDGSLLWAQIEANLARDGRSGKPVCHATMSDISGRKQSTESLRSEHLMLEKAEGIANIGSWEWDIATDTVKWSDELFRIFQRDPHEGAPSFAEHAVLYLPEDMARLRQAVEVCITDGTPYELELRAVRKDGEIRVCVARGVAEMGPGGRTVRLVGSLQDITRQKQAVELLRESESRLKLAIEALESGIWELNVKTGKAWRSLRHDQIFGYMTLLPEWTYQTFLDHVITEDRSEVDSNYGYALSKGTEWNFECRIRRADQVVRWIHALGKPSEYDDKNEVVMLTGIIRDITERKLDEEKLVNSYNATKKALDDAINTMVKIVELRDPYTAGHQQKVAELSIAIAGEMKLDDTRLNQLHTAALIHDIGKMYVPSDILSKPGKLADIELGLIKTHSRSGYDIVKSMDFPGNVAVAVLQHHERLDGSGYPNQLKGEDTLLEAKILAVADVVEAMSSHRPYRPALGIDKALEEISKNRGKLYDPDVVDVCMDLFKSGKFEFK